MIKETPDWFDMDLSELVEKSLAMKVVPIIHFVDRDTIVNSSTPVKAKPFSETPASHLQDQVNFYKRMIDRLDKREGIAPDTTDKVIKGIQRKIRRKLRQFERAVQILSSK